MPKKKRRSPLPVGFEYSPEARRLMRARARRAERILRQALRGNKLSAGAKDLIRRMIDHCKSS